MNDSSEKIADRLTVILGLLGLLHDGAFGQVTDRQKGALVELLATSDELREILARTPVNGMAEKRAK